MNTSNALAGKWGLWELIIPAHQAVKGTMGES
jgi:hypothetical protein